MNRRASSDLVSVTVPVNVVVLPSATAAVVRPAVVPDAREPKLTPMRDGTSLTCFGCPPIPFAWAGEEGDSQQNEKDCFFMLLNRKTPKG